MFESETFIINLSRTTHVDGQIDRKSTEMSGIQLSKKYDLFHSYIFHITLLIRFKVHSSEYFDTFILFF